MRNYAKEAELTALPRAETKSHPLVPEEKQQKTMLTTRIGGDEPSSVVATATPAPAKVISDPLGVLAPSKASFDPLGVVKSSSSSSPAFFDPLGVGAKSSSSAGSTSSMPDAPFTAAPSIMERAIAQELKSEESVMDEMIEEGFVPWSSKKQAVLQKYTTNESVGILASFMQDMPAHVSMPVETTQRRLHELERSEDDEDRQLEVSQAEYVKHIESLETALRKAWDAEQNRVLALKIVIRCAKVKKAKQKSGLFFKDEFSGFGRHERDSVLSQQVCVDFRDLGQLWRFGVQPHQGARISLSLLFRSHQREW